MKLLLSKVRHSFSHTRSSAPVPPSVLVLQLQKGNRKVKFSTRRLKASSHPSKNGLALKTKCSSPGIRSLRPELLVVSAEERSIWSYPTLPYACILYGVPKWTKWRAIFFQPHIISDLLYNYIRPPISYQASYIIYKTSYIISDLLYHNYKTSYIISDLLYHIRLPISYRTSYIISDLLYHIRPPI